MIDRATYSPEDNKIRLYPACRLAPELYARVKETGYAWAPKQGIFVAPMWTPAREDLAIELAGDLDDEDTSLVARAEQRAERFEEYRDKRTRDAEQAHAGVSAIADNIPLGQPILVGHHSERRARKDAERIEHGMRRAVKMWDTAAYWKDRARGALLHAKYKENPRVRARRIKTLEADQRRHTRGREKAEMLRRWWERPDITIAQARDRFYETIAPEVTIEDLRARMLARYDGYIVHEARWIAHLDNRIAYERAMLADQGAAHLLDPAPKRELLPLCNYRADGGAITMANLYHRSEMVTYPQVDMTSAEYAQINKDYKGTRVVGQSHRVRIAMLHNPIRSVSVFLTDSKVHARPADVDPTPTPPPSRPLVLEHDPEPAQPARAYTPDPERVKADQVRAQLAAGVQVVSAPQLFPTPAHVARRVFELADVQPGECVLEPSAGTGNLIAPIVEGVDTEILAYEINGQLCAQLRAKFPSYRVHVEQADFLAVTAYQGQYPKIVMNPPFKDGADIKHIQHARTFLRPGGRLVAICANGPRQQRAFRDDAIVWEELEPGTFEGTNVRAAIMVLEGV